MVSNTGIEVKIARLRAGVKQYQLAGMLGIGVSQLSEMETGRRPVSPDMAERIKEVLDESQKTRA
jgi:transcriptional regulator with XRE-family HTH domain